MAHCAIVSCRSPHFRHQIKMAAKEKQSQSQANSNTNPNRLSASAAAAVARIRSTSPAGLILDANSSFSSSSNSPPFFLNPDEFVEIKVTNESSESFRLVLEFLYTDQIVSIEGIGIFKDLFLHLKSIYNIFLSFLRE
jgi:hypothetical protein